jgi:uncharacterized membrane protein YeaQ/YmgE (transglycosylase-associated protein family)
VRALLPDERETTMLWVIFSWLVFGLVIGLVARAIFPGTQNMGISSTIGLGVLGSFVGGFVANLLFGHPIGQIHAVGFIGSVLGALLILAISQLVRRRSADA